MCVIYICVAEGNRPCHIVITSILHFSVLCVSVGSPMEVPKLANPTTEQIDKYHEQFLNCLIKLFEAQKHNYLKNADTVTLELI